MLFQEPLNEQDRSHLGAILEKLELDRRPVNIDDGVSRIKRLHPTLKKCKCGFIGTKHMLYKHFDEEKKQYPEPKLYYQDHGESILDEDEV